MSLRNKLSVAVAAGQPGIRINTDEIPDALKTISETCKHFGWNLQVWDKAKGLQAEGLVKKQPKKTGLAGLDKAEENKPTETENALAVLYALWQAPPQMASESKDEEDTIPVVLVMKNMHMSFEGQPEKRELVVSLIQHVLEDGKENSKFLVGLMPTEAQLPPEIDPLFHVIDHELPDEAELLEILDGVVTEGAGDDEEEDEEAIKELTDADKKSIAKAALGLTRMQAEGAFSSSIVEHKQVLASEVWRSKATILNRDGLVELRESNLGFKDIGGLHGFKSFLNQLMQYDPLQDEDPDAMYKGVVAVGPPGVGKSLMAYCVGNENNIPTLLANPGNLMNKWVGDTEKNTRKFFQIIKRMSPCVVVLDEIGQTMPKGDGGEGSEVSSRMLGTFLTQLNDIRDPVLWFFTSNDVEKMHEAFLRAERVDAKFYVRLPDATQRAAIWSLYLKKFFPPKVKGKPCERHLVLNVGEVMKQFTTAKKANVDDFANRLSAALMACEPEAREKNLNKILGINEVLGNSVKALLIDDEGWTPAEIRSCCRLARRLRLGLFESSKRTGHVCLGSKGEKMLNRLDRWAINDGALDGETGQLFELTLDAEEAAVNGAPGEERQRVRRRVKRLDRKKKAKS
jgi:SpoVK/Ycf46/Vps4 family AAA+-type ATPase